MPTHCNPDLFGFAPVEDRSVVAAFDGGAMTSDAGALLLGAADRAVGLIDRFAACFVDHRDGRLIEHELRGLVGQRVFGIALGYEDLIDHDTLRHDPAMAVLAGKLRAKRRGCAEQAAGADRAGPGRHRRSVARAAGGALLPRLLRRLVLPAAVHLLRPASAGRQAAAREHRRLGGRGRRGGADRRPAAPALAACAHPAAGGCGVRPRGVDGLVRGQRGRLPVRPGAQSPAGGGA